MTQRNRTPTLADVIRAAIDQDRADLNVCLPGQLTSYDATQQKGDVQPLLRRPLVDSDGNDIEAEVLPSIPSVPIVFPRSGQYFISFPLKVGDLVTLFFVQRSLDRFMTNAAAVTDPVDLRMHDISDAIAMPGLYPFPQALTSAHADNLVIGNDITGTQIHVKAAEVHLGAENAAEFVALGQKVDTAVTNIQGKLDSLIGKFTLHTHGAGALVAPPSGGPVTGITAPAAAETVVGPQTSVQATIVKAT